MSIPDWLSQEQGLRPVIRDKLIELCTNPFTSNQFSLQRGIIKHIRTLTEADQVRVLEEFSHKNWKDVRNPTGFFIDLCRQQFDRRHRRSPPLMSPPYPPRSGPARPGRLRGPPSPGPFAPRHLRRRSRDFPRRRSPDREHSPKRRRLSTSPPAHSRRRESDMWGPGDYGPRGMGYGNSSLSRDEQQQGGDVVNSQPSGPCQQYYPIVQRLFVNDDVYADSIRRSIKPLPVSTSYMVYLPDNTSSNNSPSGRWVRQCTISRQVHGYDRSRLNTGSFPPIHRNDPANASHHHSSYAKVVQPLSKSSDPNVEHSADVTVRIDQENVAKGRSQGGADGMPPGAVGVTASTAENNCSFSSSSTQVITYEDFIKKQLGGGVADGGLKSMQNASKNAIGQLNSIWSTTFQHNQPSSEPIQPSADLCLKVPPPMLTHSGLASNASQPHKPSSVEDEAADQDGTAQNQIDSLILSPVSASEDDSQNNNAYPQDGTNHGAGEQQYPTHAAGKGAQSHFVGSIRGQAAGGQVTEQAQQQLLPAQQQGVQHQTTGSARDIDVNDGVRARGNDVAGVSQGDSTDMQAESQVQSGFGERGNDRGGATRPPQQTHLQAALNKLTKQMLKPCWKRNELDREQFKEIVKRVVSKVCKANDAVGVQDTEQAVAEWLHAARRDKIQKLVNGYLERYGVKL